MKYTKIKTSLCEIVLVGDKKGLLKLHLVPNTFKDDFKIIKDWEEDDRYFKESIFQIKEFLKGNLKNIDVKINPQGTDFQMKVWKQMQKIPYGKTCSYKDLAIAIGNEKACRAIGMANNRNPLPLIIPCHRVIGSDGSLTGFGGGIDIKKKLLEIEKN